MKKHATKLDCPERLDSSINVAAGTIVTAAPVTATPTRRGWFPVCVGPRRPAVWYSCFRRFGPFSDRIRGSRALDAEHRKLTSLLEAIGVGIEAVAETIRQVSSRRLGLL